MKANNDFKVQAVEEGLPSFPYQIKFVDIDPSDAVRSKIEAYLSKIESLHPKIINCEVMLRMPHRHSAKHYFHIHIHLDIPGHRFIVDREPEVDEAHLDPYVALHAAFQKLNRQMEDFLRSRRDQHRIPQARV